MTVPRADLVIKADDWFVGVWWSEFAPGCFPPLPRGGHRLALARLLTSATPTQPPTWIIEDGLRAAGETEWVRGQEFSFSGMLAILERMGRLQQSCLSHGATGAGSLEIMGGPADALRLIACRHEPMPAWMHVIIEERREP